MEYCPKKSCYDADARIALEMVRDCEKRARYDKYLELKKEFEDE